MKLVVLFLVVTVLATGCHADCQDDDCDDEDFQGFGTPASKCGCCPWPCCCKCFEISTGIPGPCRAFLDLTFILDASGSIGDSNWVITKDFVVKVASALESVGTDQRVAMITYSTNASLEWNLQDAASDSSAALEAAIMGLALRGRFTNTVEAMEVAVTQVFGSSDDEPSNPNVAVIITDGRSNYRTQELTSMSGLLQGAADVYAVGVTSKIDFAELTTITGDANKVFTVADFSQLSTIIDDLHQVICPVVPTEEKCFCCCTPEQFFGGGGAYYYSGY